MTMATTISAAAAQALSCAEMANTTADARNAMPARRMDCAAVGGSTTGALALTWNRTTITVLITTAAAASHAGARVAVVIHSGTTTDSTATCRLITAYNPTTSAKRP